MTTAWLAYKYVAVSIMLAEINYCAEKLRLPIQLPVERTHLEVQSVSPPNLFPFGGRLDTKDFSFSFAEDGRLQYIYALPPRNQSTPPKKRSHKNDASLLTTNEAYCLASNWLYAMSVDVRELQRTNHLDIYRPIEWDGEKNKEPRSVFHVEWGPRNRTIAEASIGVRSRTLRYLRLEDTSFSKRPPVTIKEREKLLSIPDEEFLKLDEKGKQDLVKRFWPAADRRQLSKISG